MHLMAYILDTTSINMKKTIKLFWHILPLLLLCVKVSAQSSPVSSGGEASGSGGTASYTLGQVVFSSYSTKGGYIIEGVQQAYTDVELPISLLAFNATVTNNRQVALSWLTVSESNNQYFTIERSTDGVSFSMAIKVKGKGDKTSNQNYDAVDASPVSGISYYRLKQTDIDGRSTYSKSIKVNITASEGELSAYPNPTTTILNLRITDAVSKKLIYLIYSIDGKLIEQQKISTDLTAISTSKLINGTYLLQVKQNGATIKSFKIIKN